MSLATPLISVIIPAYNAGRFIVETLDSVVAQTYRNLEIIVVDDGSSDSTQEIITAYAERDTRISLFSQGNAGVAAARNLGIQKAQGEFIAPLDADDTWLPEYIESLLPLMAEPTVGMAYAWSFFTDEDSNLLKTCQSNCWQGSNYIPLIYRNLPGNASCVLFRRSCLAQLGGYDSSYRGLNAQGCEDWDLYLRLARSFEVRVFPRLLVGYRQVRGSMSTNPEPMGRGVDLILERLAKQHPEIDPSIYAWSRSNFSWYLAMKYSQVGNHRKALFCMNKALSLDYFPLLRVGFYRLGITSLLKVLFHPITSLIWADNQAWLSCKKRWINWIKTWNPFCHEISLAQLQRQQLVVKNRFPWYQYEKFVTWRCDRIHRQAQKALACASPTSSAVALTHFKSTK